jgi:hypothetical protein
MDRKKINGIIIVVFLIILSILTIVAVTGDNTEDTDEVKKDVNISSKVQLRTDLFNIPGGFHFFNSMSEHNLIYKSDTGEIDLSNMSSDGHSLEYYFKEDSDAGYSTEYKTIKGHKGFITIDTDFKNYGFTFIEDGTLWYVTIDDYSYMNGVKFENILI